MSTTLSAAGPAWLVQYSPRGFRELRNGWLSGEDVEYPAVDRNVDAIGFDDLVFFWVSGPAERAGVVGFGVASGEILELQHARNYREPDGPRASRASAEVALGWVGDRPVITRDELKGHPAFADFDLFKMARRPNAFAVTREQTQIILARLAELVGR